jgi:quercetin dioxygenase-like cupin family protein
MTELKKSDARWRGTSIAAAAGALMLVTTSAFAGGCPADNMVADGRGQKPSSAAAVGVSDTVIASTDLATEPVGINDRLFRLRKLVVKPGGVVPWHSHANRPAIIYIISGTIVEYSSTCSVPIVHKAGDVTAETHATSHWWKNTGKETVVLLSADLLQKQDNGNAHMM